MGSDTICNYTYETLELFYFGRSAPVWRALSSWLASFSSRFMHGEEPERNVANKNRRLVARLVYIPALLEYDHFACNNVFPGIAVQFHSAPVIDSITKRLDRATIAAIWSKRTNLAGPTARTRLSSSRWPLKRKRKPRARGCRYFSCGHIVSATILLSRWQG